MGLIADLLTQSQKVLNCQFGTLHYQLNNYNQTAYELKSLKDFGVLNREEVGAVTRVPY